jgi:hypothetical protein
MNKVCQAVYETFLLRLTQDQDGYWIDHNCIPFKWITEYDPAPFLKRYRI